MATAVRSRAQRRKTDRTGQRERRKSHRGRTRLPDLRKAYRFRRSPVEAGKFEFRFTLVGARGPGGATHAIPLDRLLTEASWTDESSTLNGSMTVQRPDPADPNSLRIAKGHRVACSVHWGGRWRPLWVMRVQDAPVDPITGLYTLELTDDLILLTRNRRDWTYRKTKKRKRGWYLHEIARDVTRREGLRLASIARGRKRIDKLVKKDASALEVLRAACAKEQEANGVRFVIRMAGGALSILPYRRNRVLYELGEGKEEAAELVDKSADRPVTVIEAKGHIGKGKDAKKIKVKVLDRSVIRRYGRVVDERNYGKVTSRADLEKKARRDLAKAIRTRRTGTITHRGIPFIRRGDGIRWRSTEPGWYGRAEHSRDRSFLFTTGVTHTLQPPEYTMDVGVVQEDPFHKDQERRDKLRRKKARERRKRRRGQHG